MPAKPVFFNNADEFRSWLAAHSSAATEVIVGFTKSRSGSATLTCDMVGRQREAGLHAQQSPRAARECLR